MARTLSPKLALSIEAGVVVALTGAGLFASQGLRIWYLALLEGFAMIATPVLVTAALVTWHCERMSGRLQGARRIAALNWRGVRDTALSAYIAACLLAWPLARMRAGEPTGLVWTAEEAGGLLGIVLGNIGGILLLDGWLYLKHRLLHTRWMFAFHRTHHVYRDPTALSGFAVGPVEALLTFWPVVLLALPQAPHYGPVYFSLVIGFVLFNLYLHCGVVWRGLEAVLRPLSFNTSTHHNRHHANAETHYAEALTLWDRILGTHEGAVRALRRNSPQIPALPSGKPEA
jgi:sterol desaturase/sphingolipid hydroxylase (fatty acid hydroxylase superfamily)